MPSQWYYRHGNEEFGPLSFADLRALVKAGSLSETDLVRRATSDEWEKAYRVIGLFVDGPLADGPRVAAASNEEVSPAISASPQVDATRPMGERLGFWAAPMDRFELALLTAMVTCLACVFGWWRWSESMEARFPAPSRRSANLGMGIGTAPDVMQSMTNMTETRAGGRP